LLIILSKSPTVNDYNSMLEIAKKAVENGERVAVLHVQDSCIATTLDEYCEKLAEERIDTYVLRADCEARGLLERVGREVKIINYKAWVKLVMDKHSTIVSWT